MIHSVEIFLWGTRIGVASFAEDSDVANFEYDSNFIKSGIEVSPLFMPLSNQIYSFPSLSKQSFKGLPGLLSDSLPDKFGDAVIDAWLKSKGRSLDSLTPIERLCYVGKRGMGALEYVPSFSLDYDKNELIGIESMASLASAVLSKREDLHLDEEDATVASLLKFGTSAGGARAKAIIAINEKTGDICSGQISDRKEYSYWIIKFDDIENNGDHGEQDSKGFTRVEYAYYLMVINAGIKMNECRLKEDNGKYHFLTKRFDREEKTGNKIHMQTLGALAHLDFNVPKCCSYEKCVQVCMRLGLGNDELCELYRRMVFNVLAINCDDHVKNISFLMNKKGQWSLAPAYDICFSYKPDSIWVSEHQMTINGKSKDINKLDLLQCAKSMNISERKANTIINDVVASISRWKDYASIAKVKEEHIKSIGSLLEDSINKIKIGNVI